MFLVRQYADSACQDVEIVGSRGYTTKAKSEFAYVSILFVDFKFRDMIV